MSVWNTLEVILDVLKNQQKDYFSYLIQMKFITTYLLT